MKTRTTWKCIQVQAKKRTKNRWELKRKKKKVCNVMQLVIYSFELMWTRSSTLMKIVVDSPRLFTINSSHGFGRNVAFAFGAQKYFTGCFVVELKSRSLRLPRRVPSNRKLNMARHRFYHKFLRYLSLVLSATGCVSERLASIQLELRVGSPGSSSFSCSANRVVLN